MENIPGTTFDRLVGYHLVVRLQTTQRTESCLLKSKEYFQHFAPNQLQMIGRRGVAWIREHRVNRYVKNGIIDESTRLQCTITARRNKAYTVELYSNFLILTKVVSQC